MIKEEIEKLKIDIEDAMLSGISFTQVEMILKIVLLILSIVYTTDKIIKNRKKNG
jgi:hypothetical protein